MAQVIYSPAAAEDIVEIVRFIARDKPIAAKNWLRMIRQKCEALAEHPERGEERVGYGVPGRRSFSVGQYVIFFRAIPGGIEVARIIHGSRDLGNL